MASQDNTQKSPMTKQLKFIFPPYRVIRTDLISNLLSKPQIPLFMLLRQIEIESVRLLGKLISMVQTEDDELHGRLYFPKLSQLWEIVEQILHTQQGDLVAMSDANQGSRRSISGRIAVLLSKPQSPQMPSEGGPDKMREIQRRLQQIDVESRGLLDELLSMVQTDNNQPQVMYFPKLSQLWGIVEKIAVHLEKLETTETVWRYVNYVDDDHNDDDDYGTFTCLSSSPLTDMTVKTIEPKGDCGYHGVI